ncbi:hypothetical protein RUM44_012395 [Polyplax serrata]|uniref:Rab-GAP TBC domain-containing protein n=1 Tax=Polyplax serrata TaxID=468196 RepID=A0ABR1BB64_POLSC
METNCGSWATNYKIQLVPRAVVLRREQKWIHMLSDWRRYMLKDYKKIKERCRKGIPPSLRSRAWLYLCGGQFLMEQSKGLYDDLCKKEGDPRWMDDIKKDLHRQFPYHEMFVSEEGVGQKELSQVLKCFSILNPAVGYCQAQAPLAAFLLMHMPAEQAFWCLVSICDKYLVGYYSQGMESVQLDGDILFGLLKKMAPRVHKHIKKQKMEPILYMTEWFLCVFTRSLPWATVLRIWDMFLCEGVKVIFKAALVIMKFSLDNRATLKNCPTMYETLEVLRNPPPEILEEYFLIPHVIRLDISEEDFKKEHEKQLKKRKASKTSAKNNNKQ